MADSRFYESRGPVRLSEIVAVVGGRLTSDDGDDPEISDVSPLDCAGTGAVAYFEDERYAPGFETTRASAILVREEDAERAQSAGARAIVVAYPQAAFAQATVRLFARREIPADLRGISPDAHVATDARISATAVVGAGARIEAGAAIGPGAVIGPGVRIGADSSIGAGVVIFCADVGARVKILANAVIGEDGFGVAVTDRGMIDRPHVGRVRIGDDVTIGAATTIDRGALDETVIGDGTKIDNLVQIAHNVKTGRDCVIAGCCGLSGSVTLGDGVMLGGSVGIADHCVVGDRAKLAGATLVMRDVPPGETWAGTPAKPIRLFFREVAALNRLARPK
jgi:UDP-3-O-[3-hydroxymyristoyl] glucosamine N-acyltransferase